ncbi:OLC1v1002974C1 [Oldenlandia corymbosa var. corymbosa]|uniref:OLC1v1002974C1 n=1 Tax=Oldenlandia corymbosa var. corymbosa TaxID=529605 RepID=A0AAV1DA89_OLDCO|nr:OLC1v1002974C1 [Oldenlandia corymbosa var. corymbosa]
MESRRQGDLQWLQPSSNGLRTMPENHPFSSSPAVIGGGDNRLSQSPSLVNHSQSEYDPYYPNPAAMHNIITTTAAAANNPNNYPDTSFESYNFSYPDNGQQQQFPVYVDIHNYGNIIGNENDLQRMRVDSAVRGLYFQPDNDAIWNNFLLRQQQEYSWNINDAVFRPEPLVYNSGRNNNNRVMRERSFDTVSSSSSSFGGRNRGGSLRQQNFSSSLEELRSKIFTSFEELRGKIFIVAKDQNGCRDLQKLLTEGKPEEKDMIFSELKNHVRELMMDQFANYLAQKMFEFANEEQITELVMTVVSEEHKLMTICLDTHGTRAMQKLLGRLITAEQRSLVVSALRRITVTLTKNANGHHVIEHCLKYFPNENKTYILSVVADNCLDIATDKSGCCVLQQCVEHARGDPRDRLVSEIISNAFVLSEHPYGNYVVQFLVGLKIPQITRDILAQLSGNFVSLSMNKYGSNVVEKCMKEASEEQAMQIIQEIIGSQNFLTLLQDPFGNYVAQSAFSHAKGSIRHAMMNLIQMHYSYLHSHPHGKRVLARARGSRQRV